MKYINTNKINQLEINKDNVCVVLDFDRTITSEESTDSWDASGRILGKEFKEEMQKYYEKYRPIELDYTMSEYNKERHMEDWYSECMNLYYIYKLTKEKMEKSIKESNLIFQKGAKEFIQKLIKLDIPTIILSAGIGNTIKQFLKENECLSENIYIISNFIKFDNKGNMKKFDDNIIHSMNKTMKGKLPSKFRKLVKERKYRILVGDIIEDIKMVEKKEWRNTLKIGFLNNKEENLEKYKINFDIVLTKEDATFETIDKNIKYIVQSICKK